MPAVRFFIDAPLAEGSVIELPDRVAHHATRVLRLRDGSHMVLFNGTGGEFAATLQLGLSHPRAVIERHHALERESPLSLTLVQAWVDLDKIEWVVEKAVELGVRSIVLVPAQRSVVRLTSERLAKRLTRLRDVIVTACSQCGRNRIPAVQAAPDLGSGLALALAGAQRAIMLDPRAGIALSKTVLLEQRMAIAVGPEGGFDEAELVRSSEAGWIRASLGPRIMRTETAGVAALAVLQAVAGDFADRMRE